MSSNVLFPTATYSGVQTSAVAPIDDASTSFEFQLDRSGLWSSTQTVARIDVTISDDGFQTSYTVSCTTQGKNAGTAQDDGGPGFVQYDLRPGTGRQAKVTLTITNGLVHTTGTLIDS